MRRRIALRGPVVVVLAVSGLSIAVSACGSGAAHSSSNGTAAATTARSVDAIEQARVKAATCMRAHGVNFPDPAQAASNLSAYVNALSTLDVNSPAYRAAAAPCRGQALSGLAH